MNRQKEYYELIELLGVHFEKHQNLPPLASRILSYLIINNKESGVTFEELVTELQASKSSVSTSINLLQNLDNIYYCTQKGDRKKYFKVSPFSNRLKKYMENIEDELHIIDKLIQFRDKNIVSQKDELILCNIKTYKEHMLKTKNLLVETMSKIISIENSSN